MCGCELLAKRIIGYSFKTDSAGNLTEEPNGRNDDELDAARYLCLNVPINKSKIIAQFTDQGVAAQLS